MAYGSPIRDNYRQAADYVAEILRGVKPAELAVAPADRIRLRHQSEVRRGARPRAAAGAGRPRRQSLARLDQAFRVAQDHAGAMSPPDAIANVISGAAVRNANPDLEERNGTAAVEMELGDVSVIPR